MCVLRLFSDVRSFKELATLESIPIYSIHDKGEIRRKKSGEIYESFQISFDVSQADWDNFPQQIVDAISFLLEYQNLIEKVLEAYTVDRAYLDFPLWSRLNDDIINQNDHLPSELIKLAGKLGLGIEMSYYLLDAFEEVANETEQDAAANP